MKSPAFQFYPNDWLSSPRVAMMTPAQEGAYIRLLCYDWANDGIPDNQQQLAALSRLGEEWGKGGYAVVMACFNQHPTKPGFLTNDRLQQEREKQRLWSEKSKAGGKNSAVKRWGKDSLVENKGGYKMVTPCLPNGSNQSVTLQSSSSSSTIKPPIVPQGGLGLDFGGNGKHDKAAAEDILIHLNLQADRSFELVESNLKPISCRLEEVKGDVEGVKMMIDRQVARWKNDPEHCEYLRPETLFNKTKFHGYYGTRKLPVQQTHANGLSGSSQQPPPSVQLRALDGLIATHICNRDSANHKPGAITPKDREDWKELNAKRQFIQNEIAKSVVRR